MNPLSQKALERILPPNVSASSVRSTAGLSLAGVTLFSLADFMSRYSQALDKLYSKAWNARILIPGAVIDPYSQMIGFTVLVFAVLTALALASAALMAASFRQGARSIYLMRRLPDGGRTLRRCVWTAPLRLALLSALWGLALLVIYYLIWRFITPAQCLGPAFEGGLFPRVVY